MNVEGTASGQDVVERRQSEVRSAATIFILKIFFEVGVSLASLLQ